jgi:general stress protein 26
LEVTSNHLLFASGKESSMPMIDTALDPRFSASSAPPTPWEQTRKILEDAEVSWISTVRDDGRPHVTPLVTVWLDGALYFTSGPDEQKVRNLDSNPAVVITTGTSRWDDGTDVTVEGLAHRVVDGELLERLASAWRRRWDGRWVFDVADGAFQHAHGGVSHVYQLVPSKVLAFAKSPFAQTRHRFLEETQREPS